MVRTADSSMRVGGKASKKAGGRSTSSNDSSRSRSPSSSGDKAFSSYNGVCPRETPTWQKPITSFFNQSDKSTKNDITQSTSKTDSEDIMTETSKQNEQQQITANADENMEPEHSKGKLSKNDKENEAPASFSHKNVKIVGDAEMQELNENTKKKINLRDDSEDEDVPKKKIKLDANMYEHFEKIEQSEVMIS